MGLCFQCRFNLGSNASIFTELKIENEGHLRLVVGAVDTTTLLVFSGQGTAGDEVDQAS